MMGETLAQTLCGNKTEYKPGHWFNSAKFFDIEYQTYGWVFSKPRENETHFHWKHEDDTKCITVCTETSTGKFLGINTFGWTFANRGLEVPEPAPWIKLEAPSGGSWEWNEPSETNCVTGSATEFCQVVAQTRNVADTQLKVVGPTAAQWMAIAQCFAGPPNEPPRPGHRHRVG